LPLSSFKGLVALVLMSAIALVGITEAGGAMTRLRDHKPLVSPQRYHPSGGVIGGYRGQRGPPPAPRSTSHGDKSNRDWFELHTPR